MNQAQACQLIKETFTQAFDKTRFRAFAINLLNHVDEGKAFSRNSQYIKEAFRNHVQRFERLGTYTSPDKETVDVLIVYLTADSKLERARTAIRNFVADHLKDRDNKDAALVAFVSPDFEDWRFSLVKMEYTTRQTETGEVKLEEKLTPARRYSFLVGKNETSHTAQAQLVHILGETDKDPTLAELGQAFSVEKVSDTFFGHYKRLLIAVKESLDAVLRDDERVREDFAAKDVSRMDFVKKLLGQIIFLYFLQKKGWFGVSRDGAWGSGPKDFLRRLFEKNVVPYDNFFNDVLEPLFYEALARERDEDFYSRFRCKIPFLNGGLFDPLRGYDWVHTDIILPNDLFSNQDCTSEGDTGTGILDVLDRYNFTVNEAEPLETEVAIDPEFLGKIFEKLNAITDKNFKLFKEAEKSGRDRDVREFNKKNGVYYTPREEVHYMCQQALCYHLETALEGKCTRQEIEAFVYRGEQHLDFEANPTQRHDDKRLPDGIRQHAPEIDRVMEQITVCDPAIGSGAFPVGMLTEIVRLRSILSIPLKRVLSRYDLKRNVIEKCLYGVDIDPGAVEIAKLRLWLSLVVDEDDIRQIKPLPNLDYKIMQGNSLLDHFEGVKLFDDSRLNLIDLDAETEKASIKERISKMQTEILSLHGSGRLTKIKRAEIEQDIKRQQRALTAFEAAKGKRVVQQDLMDQLNESRKKLAQLQKKHMEFFEVQSRKRKEELRKELEELEWSFMEATLREDGNAEALKHLQKRRNMSAKPFFLWKLHFAEVFQGRGGFDIVIGNPPYVRADVDESHLKMRREIENSGFYDTLWEKWDLYVPFIERGYKFLRPGGVITYIVSDAYCHAKYAQKSQNWFLKNSRVLRLDFLGKIQIFDAGVRNVTFFFQRADGESNKPERRVHEAEFGRVKLLTTDEQTNLTCRVFFAEEDGALESSEPTVVLGDICYISYGLRPSSDEHEAKGEFVTADLVSENKDTIHSKAYVEGKHLDRWLPATNLWLEWGTKRAPGQFCRPTFPEMYEVPEKIITQRSPGPDPVTCLDERQFVFTPACVGFIHWQSLKGVRNRSLQKSARYRDEKPKPTSPKREGLEETSSRFAVKYLLAVMNSTVARDFLRANRRSNIHLYPEDWKKLPIPDATPDEQAPIVALVDQILTARLDDPDADISALERETDESVSALYGIKPEEIKIVEQTKGTISP